MINCHIEFKRLQIHLKNKTICRIKHYKSKKTTELMLPCFYYYYSLTSVIRCFFLCSLFFVFCFYFILAFFLLFVPIFVYLCFPFVLISLSSLYIPRQITINLFFYHTFIIISHKFSFIFILINVHTFNLF
jgi:hypothetical protein